MSDPTPAPDMYAAARERDRLGDEYRAAYRQARGGHNGPTHRMRNAAVEIRNNAHLFELPDTPASFIDGIDREVDHALNIEAVRSDISAALNAVDQAVLKLRKLLQEAADLDDDEFGFDLRSGVEATAFANLKLNLTALRHTARGTDSGELA